MDNNIENEKTEEKLNTMAFDVYAELRESNKAIRDINEKLIRTIRNIVFAFALVLLFVVGGFLWYISLPIEDVYVDSGNGGYANYVGNDLSGVINNGENQSETKSSPQ